MAARQASERQATQATAQCSHLPQMVIDVHAVPVLVRCPASLSACHVVILSLRHHHHYPVCRCRCRHCRHFKFIALQFVERHAAYTQFWPMNFYACCVALANYAMHFRLIRLIADSTRTGFNLSLYHD